MALCVSVSINILSRQKKTHRLLQPMRLLESKIRDKKRNRHFVGHRTPFGDRRGNVDNQYPTVLYLIFRSRQMLESERLAFANRRFGSPNKGMLTVNWPVRGRHCHIAVSKYIPLLCRSRQYSVCQGVRCLLRGPTTKGLLVLLPLSLVGIIDG